MSLMRQFDESKSSNETTIANAKASPITTRESY